MKKILPMVRQQVEAPVFWEQGEPALSQFDFSSSRSMIEEKGCGERAGARTQDQRLKRAMLYQLSYPLAPV
jgi:hypothetical protein